MGIKVDHVLSVVKGIHTLNLVTFSAQNTVLWSTLRKQMKNTIMSNKTHFTIKAVMVPFAIIAMVVWILAALWWVIYRSLAERISPINVENYRYKYE